jgi:hypothetical protein
MPPQAAIKTLLLGSWPEGAHTAKIAEGDE